MDFDELEQDREAAREDKADLFDFYHANWDRLVEYAKSLKERLVEVVGE